MSEQRDPEHIETLLQRFRAGDREAAQELVSIFYDELHRLAAMEMRGEAPGHTLQPTALVNELYRKIAAQAGPRDPDAGGPVMRSESDFFGVARYLMAQILTSHGRKKRATKRDHIKVPLYEAADVGQSKDSRWEDLMRALENLEKQDPELHRMIDLRFFCGCSIGETAKRLQVSETKVKMDWRVAKLWLQRELRSAGAIEPGDDLPD